MYITKAKTTVTKITNTKRKQPQKTNQKKQSETQNKFLLYVTGDHSCNTYANFSEKTRNGSKKCFAYVLNE